MKKSNYAKKQSNESIDSIDEDGEKFDEEFNDRGDVVRVANLTFVEGELGRGSFGIVRLARRQLEPCNEAEEEDTTTRSFFATIPLSPSIFRSPSRSASIEQHDTPGGQHRGRRRRNHLSRSLSEPTGGHFFQRSNTSNNNNFGTLLTPVVVGRVARNKSGESAKGPCFANKHTEGEEEEELVAVKIFRKSILKKMRTMERNKETRKMQVKTALMKVEREIAIMKKLQHVNLIRLFDVLDSPGSDMLYMVLEYMPLGEILTYQNDGTFRRKHSEDGKEQIPGVVEGHFDEETAALYFVDILHGLAYLHDKQIIHRDLKPENILLSISYGGSPVAKLSDFGVSHIFDTGGDEASDNSPGIQSDFETEPLTYGLTKRHCERALYMRKKSDSGLLTKTEGTWCFWSPEMCQGQKAFSGYAADIWAAGVCLFIFVTGRLPFFSDVPLELMETIAKGLVPFDDLRVSESLLSLLKMTLESDPDERAGLGDCLQHPFLSFARTARVNQLSEEFLKTRREIFVGEDDLRAAFHVVTRIPSVLIKNAAKQVEVAGKRLARLTKGASGSFYSDHSPVASQRPLNTPQRGGSNVMSDTSETTTSNSNQCQQPTSLPAIASEESDRTEDAKEETQHHHHHRKKLFSSIFRRTKGDGSSRQLHSKNTC